MNPAFFSDNTALLALLERWAEHGWLRALDVAFASFLARETPDAPPLLAKPFLRQDLARVLQRVLAEQS